MWTHTCNIIIYTYACLCVCLCAFVSAHACGVCAGVRMVCACVHTHVVCEHACEFDLFHALRLSPRQTD